MRNSLHSVSGVFIIAIAVFSSSCLLLPSNTTETLAKSFNYKERLPSPQMVTNTTVIPYEFNSSTGFGDQYISYFTFHENARINITGAWESNPSSDVMDFGLYIGTAGTEYVGYGADEITGWSLATGGGSPENYQGIAPLTSSSYYIRIINFANIETTGNVTVIEEYQEIPWDFSHYTQHNISIIFVGYDSNYINETGFLSYLPQVNFVSSGSSTGGTIPHLYNYEVLYANESYTLDFEAYALLNSVNGSGTTSKLNITALEYQRDHLARQDIFEPQDGRAINASAIDQFFAEQPYSSHNDFAIYLLNFSHLDRSDHKLEHWFNLSEPVTETGINRHWWRLEWDNPLNFDASFPYPGYGFNERHYFLDPYAFEWYLNWTVIWRGISTADGLHDFYTQDLDEFQKTNDIHTSTGQFAVMKYLGSWVAELIPQYLSWEPLGAIPEPDSIALEVLLFNNVTHLGFTNNDLSWTVEETFIKSIFSNLLPDSTFTTNITIVDLEDWTDIETILIDHPYTHTGDPPQPQWRYYDGYSVYSETDSRKGIDFDLQKADLVVTTYMFVLDNASFASESIPWAGKEFTGLGGGGHVNMLMELDRLYYPDRTTHRQGLTDILVHEVGHAIGFPHTFSSTQLGSDFFWDVMGYYPGTGNFSRMRIDGYRRYQADNLIESRKNDLLNFAVDNGSIPAVVTLLTEAESIFNEFQQLYQTYDYTEAKNKVKDLDPILNEIESLLSLNDNSAPTIDNPNDFEFVAGALGNVLTWQPDDSNPHNYTIYQNSSILISDDWNGGSITLNVDNFEMGTHNLTIVVYDIVAYSVTDTVWVTVLSSLSEGIASNMIVLLGVIVTGIIFRTYLTRKKK